MTAQAEISNTTMPVKISLLKKLFVMSCVISFIVGSLTGVMTYVNMGYSETFFWDWFTSFLVAAVVMAPSGMVFMMLVSRFIGFLFGQLSAHTQNFIVGLVMAVVMESVMAVATAANNIGFADLSLFAVAWMKAFLVALPLGLVISVTMTLFIKPRLDKYLAS